MKELRDYLALGVFAIVTGMALIVWSMIDERVWESGWMDFVFCIGAVSTISGVCLISYYNDMRKADKEWRERYGDRTHRERIHGDNN